MIKTPMELLGSYLAEKIFSINEENIAFANKGAVELRYNIQDEEMLTHIITESIQVIQREFTRTSSTSSGVARLTATSTLIGEIACHIMGLYNRPNQQGIGWVPIVRVGDVILEAFFNLDYIDIVYGHYDMNERLDSYIITWTAQWVELGYIPEIRLLIHGSSETPIEKIDSLYLPMTGNSLIKRFNDEEHFKELLKEPFIKAVDKLQSIAWKVDERILKAIRNHKDTFVKPIPTERLPKLRQRSKNYEYVMIVEKADYFIGKTFYQYLELDYRGRMYYVEPFLNFQGSDLSRGVMKFAEGEKITESGKWWLAVHTANSFNETYHIDDIPDWCIGNYRAYLLAEELDNISVDKMMLEDRVQWTNKNMDHLIGLAVNESIDDTAEKPVSFLACCYEWQYIDNDPNYESNLPVPVDGSNNGWQHLGAISKDEKTGELVGLVPVDIQRDFYVSTAKELIKITTDETRKSILREMPMKSIRKGISKRGSMTRAYSAGAIKIGENMYADCVQANYHIKYLKFDQRAIEFLNSGKAKEEYDRKMELARVGFAVVKPKSVKEEAFILATDACIKICLGFAKDLIRAINKVCPGPLDTMKYLQELASIKLETESSIEWETPSGFPVVYSRDVLRKVKCRSSIEGLKKGKNTQHKHCHMLAVRGKADKKSFMSGISPNFVHSMDASHMALVIENWHGSFGAVHDSFSCHASHVEDLVHVTKSEFIKMYDYDNYFNVINSKFKVTTATNPKLGKLKIEDIHDSDYFFC